MKNGGVFYLDSVKFTEIESVYKNNSGLFGGVIYCY